MEKLYIGPVPSEENCAQVGSPDFRKRALAECNRFIAQIRRHYPEPEGGYLRVSAEPHDFGTYYEVVCRYDDSDTEASKWAFDVEADVKDVLKVWDDHHMVLATDGR